MKIKNRFYILRGSSSCLTSILTSVTLAILFLFFLIDFFGWFWQNMVLFRNFSLIDDFFEFDSDKTFSTGVVDDLIKMYIHLISIEILGK